jgi:hypothetical protein
MKRLKKFSQKKFTKFHVRVDKNKSMTFYQKDLGIFATIKTDLLDYEIFISPSEAPATNEYLSSGADPYESTIADITIFEKEIFPVLMSITDIFGEDKLMSLDAVRLAIGSNENDYITIDESDLLTMDVEPSLQGLLEFIRENREGVVGFCDREYQSDHGNLIFFKSKLRNPSKTIKSIELSILSSLQQRGLYMQQYHKYFGLSFYITIRCEEISDDLLELLKALGIDWELLFFRRDLSITDWTEIECERNSINLKGFIKAKYEALGFFDINNIARLVVRNQLSFKIANKIAEMLNKAKMLRDQGFSNDKKEPLNKAEIAAAAQLSCAYYGENSGELKFDKDIKLEEVTSYEEELIKL